MFSLLQDVGQQLNAASWPKSSQVLMTASGRCLPLEEDGVKMEARRITPGFLLGNAYLLPRLHIIQHPIRQQRTQLNQLLNPQRHMTP